MRTTVGLFIPARCGSFSFLPQRATHGLFFMHEEKPGELLWRNNTNPACHGFPPLLSLRRAYHLENITRLEGE